MKPFGNNGRFSISTGATMCNHQQYSQYGLQILFGPRPAWWRTLIDWSLPWWVSCGIFRCLHHVDFCFRWKNRSTQTTSTFHQLCVAPNYWRGWWSNHHPSIFSLLSIWALKCYNYTHQTARQIAEFPGLFAEEAGSPTCMQCPNGTYQASQGHADTWWSFLWFQGGLARVFHMLVCIGEGGDRQAPKSG